MELSIITPKGTNIIEPKTQQKKLNSPLSMLEIRVEGAESCEVQIDKKRFIKVDLKAEIVYIDVDETYITAELLNISSENADDYIICWAGDHYRSLSIDSKQKS